MFYSNHFGYFLTGLTLGITTVLVAKHLDFLRFSSVFKVNKTLKYGKAKPTKKKDFVVLIHGGAGVISKNIDSSPYYDALKSVIRSVLIFINESKSSDLNALDVVEFAVKVLEDNPLFNAGVGAVYTANETHELEASIMSGFQCRAGAVSLIKSVKNPISLARLVMEKTPHIYLIGEEAEKIAAASGLERVNEAYYGTASRLEQLRGAKRANIVSTDHNLMSSMKDSGTGTVGCVCMLHGHVATATSTGGLTNKYSGRIGDTPIVGGGFYANDATCAVSATGVGEELMRHVTAYDVSARMSIGKRNLSDAARETVFQHLPRGAGGLIAVTAEGEYAMEFNCSGMFRGICDSSGMAKVGIW